MSESSHLSGLENAYAEKRDDYFACERREMLDLFPAQSRRVLDVGCGSGVFGQTLKRKFGCEIWGVEPDLKSCEKAATRLECSPVTGGCGKITGFFRGCPTVISATWVICNSSSSPDCGNGRERQNPNQRINAV